MERHEQKRAIIAYYGELVLKGKNRTNFEKKLLENVEYALADFDVEIKKQYGRLALFSRNNDATEEIVECLKVIPGIVVVRRVWLVENDFDAIASVVKQQLTEHSFKTFAVRCKRSDKTFPFTSEELNVQLGSIIQQITGARVNLSDPECTVSIHIAQEGADISFERIKGVGGLPVGTSGKMLSLLSSGIDSPVASAMMMRRGAQVHYIHFHSHPLTSRASIDNAVELVQAIQKFQPATTLHLVPLAPFQQAIAAAAPASYRVVLYRRAMFDIAERLARRIRATALITGESLGQVASQTTKNILVASRPIQLPIFRPLIGIDKEEIMSRARDIGTYDISVRPYDDCCTLLVPKGVQTHAKEQVVHEAQEKIPWKQHIIDSLENAEIITIESK